MSSFGSTLVIELMCLLLLVALTGVSVGLVRNISIRISNFSILWPRLLVEAVIVKGLSLLQALNLSKLSRNVEIVTKQKV